MNTLTRNDNNIIITIATLQEEEHKVQWSIIE